jgi:hypothetical protein
MALLAIDNLHEATSSFIFEFRSIEPRFSAETIIRKNNNALERYLERRALFSFDIFLSHAFKDANIVAGIMIKLIKMGYTVYVDWIFDNQLDREKVTKNTADILVKRMKQSKSLFYATTENAPHSKWMPWELGYKHGQSGNCAILPVKELSRSPDMFIGHEYLGIYKKVVLNSRIWICPGIVMDATCQSFDSWANTKPNISYILKPYFLNS